MKFINVTCMLSVAFHCLPYLYSNCCVLLRASCQHFREVGIWTGIETKFYRNEKKAMNQRTKERVADISENLQFVTYKVSFHSQENVGCNSRLIQLEY